MQFHHKHSKDGACRQFRLAATPIAILTAAGLAGCLADDIDVDEEGLTPGVPTYSISGQASGIAEGDLQLTLNGDETITVNNDGAFSFTTRLEQGESYTITADGHPDYSYCDLSNAQGSMPADHVDNVMADCEVLRIGTVNDDRAIHLDWDRAGDVDIAYSTDSSCDWVNASTCDDGGVIANESGGSLTVDESHGLTLGEAYSFALMVDDQASRPAHGDLARFEPSNQVNSAVIDGDTVYIGGNFLLHGAPLDSMVRFRGDTDTAEITGKFIDAGPESAIVDTAEDPNGGMFIAGIFRSINGVERTHIARLNPDGSLDESWDAEIGGDGVLSLIVDEDKLYIGGQFAEVSGNSDYSNFAVLNLDGSLDTSFATDSPDDVVWSLALSDDLLYLGGSFANIGTESRTGAAALDPDDGSLDTDFIAHTDDNVMTLKLDGNHLYLGGAFTTVNGSSQEGIAAVDTTDGTLETGFDPVLGGAFITVLAIEELDGNILVGGGFEQVNGNPQQGFASLDPATGDLSTEWDITVSDIVVSISSIQDHLYIVGEFDEVEGVPRHDVARFNLDDQSLDNDWSPLMDNLNVWRAMEFDGDIILAGQIKGAGGQRVDQLASYDLLTGELDTDWSAGTDGAVNALVKDGDKLFVGGDFSEITDGNGSTHSRSNAAALDLVDASDQGWTPEPDDIVHAMVLNSAQDRLYMGGSFDIVDGENREGLAMVDPASGDALGTTDPAVQGAVYTLSWADDYESVPAIIVGGAFTSVLGNTQDHHAVVDEDMTTVHPEVLNPSSTIQASEYSEAENYQLLGGWFTEIAGQPQSRFAGFEGEYNFDASSPEADFTVYAISMNTTEGRVIAGGSFSEFGGQDRRGLAIMDYTSGSGLSLSSTTVNTDGSVRAIAEEGNHLVIGGAFSRVEGQRRGNLAILDSSTLTLSNHGSIMKHHPHKPNAEKTPFKVDNEQSMKLLDIF